MRNIENCGDTTKLSVESFLKMIPDKLKLLKQFQRAWYTLLLVLLIPFVFFSSLSKIYYYPGSIKLTIIEDNFNNTK